MSSHKADYAETHAGENHHIQVTCCLRIFRQRAVLVGPLVVSTLFPSDNVPELSICCCKQKESEKFHVLCFTNTPADSCEYVRLPDVLVVRV